MSFVKEWRELNHNVRIALLYTAINSVGTGIWGFAVLSGYLKVLTGSNSYVGLAEGIQGLCQMAVAFPVGHFSDKFGRDKLLSIACVIGLASTVMLIISLVLGGSGMEEYVLVTAALGMLGFFSGTSNVPLEALFADSTTHDNRAKMNQYKYTTRILGSAVGPLTSILLFYLIGNSWSMTELKTVFVSGLLVSIPSILMLSLFRDDKALGAESDIAHTNSYARLEEQETPVSTDENENGDYHLLENTTANNASPISYEDQDDAIVKSHSPSALYWVPRLLAFSDVVLALASGMTIKFFPLFFKEETLLAPIEVNVVFLTTSIGVAITSVLARIVAPRIGGVRTMIAFYIPGVLLLAGMYCMSIGYDIKNGSVPLWRNEWVIVPVFVLRTSLMNCTPPIKKAIFMEHVPIAKRGRWSAFESLTRFGWSGSAFIGGLCVDKYGYGATFLITACLQAIGVVAIGIVGFFIDQ